MTSAAGGEIEKSQAPDQKWLAVTWKAVPWLVALCGLTALAHLVDLQTVCAQFAAAPSRETLPPPNLWLIVTAAGAAGLACAIPQSLARRLGAGAATLLVVLVLGLLPPGLMTVGFLVPLFVFGHAAWSRFQGKPVRMDLIGGALLLLIVSYAAARRYDALLQNLPGRLDPDADAYLKIAERHRAWQTQFREPLYIWILQLAHLFGGKYGEPFLRLVGVATSLFSVTVVFGLCWRWIGKSAAVVAATLYAGMPFLVFTAVRGLREDTVIATTFLFIMACLNVWGRAPWLGGYVALGFAGAAAVLLRLSSLNFVAVLTAVTFGYALWKFRPPLKRAALILVPAGIIALLVIPYLVHSRTVYNDPFYAVNKDIRFYANTELAGKHPDMPTAAQVAADGYAGPKITAGQYLFKYHSLPQLVSGAFEGMRRLYFGDFLEAAYIRGAKGGVPPLLYVLHLAGLIALLLPGRRFILAALICFHAPMLFLASFRWFDPRLLTVAFIGHYVGIGAAATTAVGLVQRLIRSREDQPLALGTAARKGEAPGRERRKKRTGKVG